MNAKQTYLKGKSVFIVSLLVVGLTISIVYLTGINHNRTVTSNFYLSLLIIETALFLFMTYGLYKGVGLKDNFPKVTGFKPGKILSSGTVPDLPGIDVGDGIGGVIVSIVLWVGITILVFILLIVLETVLWFSFFILLAMLYWVFFRALKFVFSKSKDTKGKIGVSALYSLAYSALYLGWIFGIVYLAETLR